ncbi:hypothetical protein VB735_24280 [Halotia wernerae UHCC 0503]|nr:hypothetical protein [Halotia wernerae UHCC 0503]
MVSAKLRLHSSATDNFLCPFIYINGYKHPEFYHPQLGLNRKDVIQMLLGQLDQKINHKFKRLLFYTRDVQRFLQRDTSFQIREYEENTEQE